MGLADIMSHVGWRNDETDLCYLKLSEALSIGGAVSALSSCDPIVGPFEFYSDLNN